MSIEQEKIVDFIGDNNNTNERLRTFFIEYAKRRGRDPSFSASVRPSMQEGGRFERVVDTGYNIGVDYTTGKNTSTFTVITEESGELVTAFPGRPNNIPE